MAHWKRVIRDVLQQLPGGPKLLETWRRYRAHREVRRFSSSRELFTHYYQTNYWGSEGSASGAGSTAAYTENLRKELAGLLVRLNVRRLLDAPCGDYHWFRLVPRGDVLYLGGDIVEPLIASNQQQYGDETTRFVPLDITCDPLPAADLWLCRDVLFHLSNRDIFRALDNFRRSQIPWLLTSSHTAHERNTDIPTGAFRLLNLERPPFEFPPPLLWIEDFIEGFPPRSLGLWEREVLASELSKNAAFRRAVRL